MIEIPHDLRWLGWLVGVDPPEGNEDLLFAIGDAWNVAAKSISAQVDPLAAVRRQATGAYHAGDGAATIAELFGGLLEGDGSLAVLARDFDEIGNAAFDFGTTVQEQKLMMIISYALLAVEITWAWMFPPTAPALEAAAVSGTRSSLRALEDATVEKIAQTILKASGEVGRKAWLKLVVKNLSTYAVKGVVSSTQSVILDVAVQGGQLAGGSRRHFDGNEVALSFGSSFLGGMVGRAAGHWGGIAFDASIGRATNRLSGAAAGVFRGMAIGAIAGEVSTLGGAMATAMNSGDWQGAFSGTGFAASMAGGAFRGGVAGGARGLFQLNRVPRGPSSTGFLRHFQVDAEGNVYTSASRAEAAGAPRARPGLSRPEPVARPEPGPAVGFEEQQRRSRELDRQDAANLRDYHRQLRDFHRELREGQPRLRATPTPPVENQPRARALGEPAGTASADRQPPWASRMSGRAEAFAARSDSAQRVATEAQAAADVAQGRATVQQDRATAAERAARTAEPAVARTRQRLDEAQTRLTAEREAADPDPNRVRVAEQRVTGADEAHSGAVRELAAARELAAHAQARADDLQSRADRSQRDADGAQSRADDLRMVRVSREAINHAADVEGRAGPKNFTANTWWEKALLRSESIGKEYGTGGPGTEMYQSKGTDLRGKTRAKVDKHRNPEIDPYAAPTAPDPAQWGEPPLSPIDPLPPGSPGPIGPLLPPVLPPPGHHHRHHHHPHRPPRGTPR